MLFMNFVRTNTLFLQEEENAEVELSDDDSDTSQPSLYPDLTGWLGQALHKRHLPRVDRASISDEEKPLGETRAPAQVREKNVMRAPHQWRFILVQAGAVQVPHIDRSSKPARSGTQLQQPTIPGAQLQQSTATPIIDRSTKPM